MYAYIYMYKCICVQIHVYIHKYISYILYSSIDKHLSCFHIMVIINNVAIIMGMHISFQISVFVPFG